MTMHVHNGVSWQQVEGLWVHNGTAFEPVLTGDVYNGASWQEFYAGGPSVVSVVLSQQSYGDCDKADDWWTDRITITFSEAVDSSYDIRVFHCLGSSGGCSPGFWIKIDGDGSTVYTVDVEYDDINFEGYAVDGEGPQNYYANAKADLVADGTTSPVLSTASASQQTDYMGICGEP